MRKSPHQLREDIGRLREQLRQAELREAERIGRIALKAGLGEIEIDEIALQGALEQVAIRFRTKDRSRKPGSDPENPALASPIGTVEA
ncbi:TraC family protein [Rhizobium halophytocola]|uniref:TraC family protein n=1 Tax=Rhizobium halophytocola TaxID=735519 RepID=A0ABS4E4F6_9HYPH|nr:TraC family protein [Rhizobium halophytocola]MBP1852828.1 hypothetical protein [Rhizobium halophytocola]